MDAIRTAVIVEDDLATLLAERFDQSRAQLTAEIAGNADRTVEAVRLPVPLTGLIGREPDVLRCSDKRSDMRAWNSVPAGSRAGIGCRDALWIGNGRADTVQRHESESFDR